MYSKGFNQFIPFIATVLAIVFTDLLLGVLIGLAISVFYILKSNYKNPFTMQKERVFFNETMRLELPNQVSFLNKASIKETLWAVPNGSKVVIDATYADFIDNDVLEIIEDFRSTISKEKDIKLNVVGLKNNYKLDDYIQFINYTDKEAQQNTDPDAVIELLKAGNERFITGKTTEKYLKQQVDATSKGQNPFAIVLSCIDSRTTTEHVFDLGLGDIFSIRIAGNILNEDILGSMEFGVHVVGVKLIVVLGHTKCGAIAGACNHVELGNLTTLLNKIKPAIENEKSVIDNRDGTNGMFVNKVAEQNVLHTIERIKKESSIISALIQDGKVKIVGGFYDIETGKVNFY
jgi:carbonic anhydrase/SulP family sulfate permease